VRYALSPYIKQTRSIFKGLKDHMLREQKPATDNDTVTKRILSFKRTSV
jgi:hypothetical protein